MYPHLVPGMSITVWYFCGKVDGPPPTSIYLWSWDTFPGRPVWIDVSRLEIVLGSIAEVSGILSVWQELAFARALLLASSKDSSLVGVEIANDFGLNFFGDAAKYSRRLECWFLLYFQQKSFMNIYDNQLFEHFVPMPFCVDVPPPFEYEGILSLKISSQ